MEEKNKISNNLKELKKSFFVKSTQSIINFNATNTTSCVNSKNDCEETAKISYKFVSRSELEEAQKKIDELKGQKLIEKSDVKTEKFFWFGAYDKLMKTKNLKKILNFYSDLIETENSSLPLKFLSHSIKEQPIILKDFEIYFDNSTESHFTFPFIRAKKEGIAFLKLYYISIKNFNKIFNYINKTDNVFEEKDFSFSNTIGDHQSLIKDKSDVTAANFKFSSLLSRTSDSYPYSELLCLGSFINTNIYTFTNYHSSLKASAQNVKFKIPRPILNQNESNALLKTKTKSIVKMIKYLTSTFPNYSAEFFVYHIFFRSGLNSDIHNGIKENNLLKINLADIKHQISKKKLKNIDSIGTAIGKRKSPIAAGKNSISLSKNVTKSNNNINIRNVNVTTKNSTSINGLTRQSKNHQSMTNIIDSYYDGKQSMNSSKINVVNKRSTTTLNNTGNFDERNKKDTTEYLSTNISNLNMYSNDNAQDNYSNSNETYIPRTLKQPVSGRNKITPTLVNNKISHSKNTGCSNNINSNNSKVYNSTNKILISNTYNKLKSTNTLNNNQSESSVYKKSKIKSVSKPNICFTEFNFITNPLYLNEISIEDIEDNLYDNKNGFDELNQNDKRINNNPSTNIFVVARDDKIRFRTDYDEDSIDTIDDYDANSQINTQNKLENISITVNSQDNACYNTPTKKKVYRYYS